MTEAVINGKTVWLLLSNSRENGRAEEGGEPLVCGTDILLGLN